MGDNPFHASAWRPVDGFANLTDITYHRHVSDATVRVAFNCPEVRNAFRPHTVDELYQVLDHARMSPDVGVVLLTGNGPSPKDGRPLRRIRTGPTMGLARPLRIAPVSSEMILNYVAQHSLSLPRSY
jgi:hypothetical protein